MIAGRTEVCLRSETSISSGVEHAFDLLKTEVQERHRTLADIVHGALVAGDCSGARKAIEKAEIASQFLSGIDALRLLWIELESWKSSNSSSANSSKQPDRPRAAISMKYNRAHASAVYDDGVVTVHGGSDVRRDCRRSLGGSILQRRQVCVQDGSLVASGDASLLRVTRDLIFPSPSAAAQFVAGCSVNGNREWQIDGRSTSLGEYLNFQKMT